MSIEKVTIIIPTFNASNTLRAALDSVKNQTFQNWECIVIDGASKDNTLEIVKSYVIEDSRFSFISEPDKGIYDAMNKGWKMAKGEWINYLGADDVLIDNGVENLLKNTTGFDIVYGNTILDLNGKRKKQKSENISRIRIKFVTCHQSLIMKKEVISKLNGFDSSYKILADYDLVLRAYLKSFKLSKINCYISIFSLNGTGGINITNVIWEQYLIYKKNKSNHFPIIYASYYFLKRYLTRIKNITIDKVLFYK